MTSNQLLNVCGHAPKKHLYCPFDDCYSGSLCLPTKWWFEGLGAWKLVLECDSCHGRWSVCSKCRLSTACFLTLAQEKRHEKRYHGCNAKAAHCNEPFSNAEPEPALLLPAMHVDVDCNNVSNENVSESIEIAETFEGHSNEEYNDEDSDHSSTSKKQHNNISTIPPKFTEITSFHVSKLLQLFNNQKVQSEFIDHQAKYHINDTVHYHMMNQNCCMYFGQMLMNINPLEELVKLANKVGCGNQAVRLEEKEIQFQMLLSQFCNELSFRQNKTFAAILNLIEEIYINSTPNNPHCASFLTSKQPHCSFPTSYAEVRRIYLDGQHSINRNLPKPIPTMLVNHSYLSILDCIADFLGHGMHPVYDFRWYSNAGGVQNEQLSIFDSVVAKQIVDNCMNRLKSFPTEVSFPVVIFLLIFWSDDFEPNKSIKSNRGSVWIKTVTIVTKTITGLIVSRVFPLALGKKGVCHDEVEQAITQNLKMLNNGPISLFLSSYYKQPVYVHADCFCVLNDQPERRSSLGLLAGNSRVHSRFGYLLDSRKTQSIIRACSNCAELINNEVHAMNENVDDILTCHSWRNEQCDSCTKWMIQPNDPLLSYIPDLNYPSSLFLVNGKMNLRKIEPKKLVECCQISHDNIVNGTFSTQDAFMFLQENGVSTVISKQVIQHGTYALTWQNVSLQQNENPEHYSSVLKHKQKNPTLYEPAKLPVAWQTYDNFEKFIEVPMHLLFLGVTKTVILDIQEWMKQRNIHSLFCQNMKGVLEAVQKLQLPWCKLLPFSNGKFGGWVSENYMGFCRLMPWFYSVLEYYESNPVNIDPPMNKPQAIWTKKENMRWLMLRNLDQTGDAKSVRDRVAHYLNSQPIPQVCTTGISYTWEDVLLLVNSLLRMMELLMQQTISNMPKYKQCLEAVIRCFLSNYAKLDSSIHTTTTTVPSWISHYNFMSLLNLPEQVSKFGPVRNYWEGGMVGEGYLRSVKREIKSGLNNQWQVWLLDHLLIDQSYRTLLKREQELSNMTSANMSKIYSDECTARFGISVCRPFVGCSIDTENTKGKTYVLFLKRKEIWGVEILFGSTVTATNKYKYVEMQLNAESILICLSKEQCIDNVNFSFLFLPKLTKQGLPKRTVNESKKFFCLRCDWKHNKEF